VTKTTLHTASANLGEWALSVSPRTVGFDKVHADVIRDVDVALRNVGVIRAAAPSEFSRGARDVMDMNMYVTGDRCPIPLVGRWRQPHVYLTEFYKPKDNNPIDFAYVKTFRGDHLDAGTCASEVDFSRSEFNHRLKVVRYGTGGDAVTGEQTRYNKDKMFREDGSRAFTDLVSLQVETTFASLRQYLGLRTVSGLVFAGNDQCDQQVRSAMEGIYLQLATVMKVGSRTDSVGRKFDDREFEIEIRLGDATYAINRIDDRTLELVGILDSEDLPRVVLRLDDDDRIVLPDDMIQRIVAAAKEAAKADRLSSRRSVRFSEERDGASILTDIMINDLRDGGRMQVLQVVSTDAPVASFTSGMRALFDEASLRIDVENYLSWYKAAIYFMLNSDSFLEHPPYLANAIIYPEGDSVRARAQEIYQEAQQAHEGFSVFVGARFGVKLEDVPPETMSLRYPLSQAFGEEAVRNAQGYLSSPWLIPHQAVRESVVAMIRGGVISRKVLGELLVLASMDAEALKARRQ
jgi:hypothetical protein